jgi:hypothetical protein
MLVGTERRVEQPSSRRTSTVVFDYDSFLRQSRNAKTKHYALARASSDHSDCASALQPQGRAAHIGNEVFGQRRDARDT